MTDTLYLRLTDTLPDAPAEGMIVGRDGSVIAGPRTESLTALAGSAFAAAHPGCRVVVLIPGTEALTTTARLPKMAASRIRASLPYALEEMLVGDLEAQHFALGRARTRAGETDGGGLDVPVVVMQRARLSSWMELLRSHGLEPAALHLEDSCVAAKPGDVIAWLRAGEALLCTPAGDALVTRIEDLGAALDLLPADPPAATLGLQLCASAEERARYGALVESAGARFSRITWLGAADSPLPWLVSQFALATPINLLQGEFLPRAPTSRITARWRLAAALAGALLLLQVAERIFVWQSAAAESRILDATLLEAVRTVRPEVQSASEAVSLLRGRAVGDSAAASARPVGDLAAILAQLAAAGLPAESLSKIVIDSGLLRLEFAAGIATESIEKNLTTKGWQLRKEALADGRVALGVSPRGSGVTP